jgi:hypothetical protein
MYNVWRDGRRPIMIEKLYEAIEHYGRYYRIYEMFESHSGSLWFTLEMFSNQPDLRYGLVCGREREFDYFSMKDMNPLILVGKVRRVPQKDWASNVNVHLVEKSRLDKARKDVAFHYEHV